MSVIKQLAILAALAAGVAAVWLADLAGPFTSNGAAATTAQAEPAAAPPAPVRVESISLASSAALVEAVGTGNALRAVTVHPETAGRVRAVLFSAGQRVAAGDALLELDAEDQRLARDLAQVRVDEALQQWRRYDTAAPSGAVPDGEVETTRTTLAAARIQLAQATLALSRRTLRAPFDGVVGIPAVEVGARVDENTIITSIDDRSAVLVDFEVPEAFAAGVAPGQAIEARTWARPGEAYTGTVDALGSRIDPLSRTLRVRARIDNEDDSLRTGMSFVIRLRLSGERFPSVPSIAVLWDRGGAYVWRVDDAGRAERVEVDVLKREDRWVLVDAPLAVGDRIVVEGVQRLSAGREVRVLEVEAEAVTTQAARDV